MAKANHPRDSPGTQSYEVRLQAVMDVYQTVIIQADSPEQAATKALSLSTKEIDWEYTGIVHAQEVTDVEMEP